MKRLSVILLLMMSFVFSMSAETKFIEQPLRVQRFEGGLKFGLGVPFAAPQGWKPDFNFGELGLELRYNFKDTPWDAGILFMLQDHHWKMEDGEGYSGGNCNAMLLGDYNFRQGRKINPYAGFAIGWDINDSQLVAAPRIGVEIFHHIRIESTFYLSSHYASMFMISAGFAIGGRPSTMK